MEKVYSRSYLQGMPEERKKQLIDKMIQEFIHELIALSARGETSYRFPIVYQTPLLHQTGMKPQIINTSHGNIPANISIDELVARFQSKFPECQISYDESWIDQSATRRYLSKAIIIDWS